MKTLHLKKGFTHPLSVKTTPGFEETVKPEKLGLVPSAFKGIKPKLFVEKNDYVKIGSPVYFDKNNPDLIFTSPGSGKITEIETGKKRIIKKIEILLDENEDYEELSPVTESNLRTISQEDLIQALLKNGLWPFIRSLPFRIIADFNKLPEQIYIKLSDNAPFYPRPEAWLKQRLKGFYHGLSVMKKLCPDVNVYADEDNHYIRSECQNSINYLVSGKYPSFDPGVIAYKINKKISDIWYLDGQSLVTIGETLLYGRFSTKKIFVVGGEEIEFPYHVNSRYGAPVSSLLKTDQNFMNKQRFISGDVYTGFQTEKGSYTGFYESGLSVVPEGDEKELFAFLKAGTDKPSFSNTFISKIFNKGIKTDCNTHGEKRACINCGYCERVCPVDILPQFTMKALHADEIDLALSHGLLDCTECSLCSYVCPSKISLKEIFTEAKAKYLKEKKAE
ncbi:MAG: 4Fe-4S dicluster domain-containing protein [Thermodesulfobacteriota bacterium]